MCILVLTKLDLSFSFTWCVLYFVCSMYISFSMTEGTSYTLQRCTLYCKALQQPELISSQPPTLGGTETLICSDPPWYTELCVWELYTSNKREIQRGRVCFIDEPVPKKALKRGSQLNCHKLTSSHFQLPKFLIMGRYTVTLHTSHFSPSPGRVFLCRRQERQLASTIVHSQLGKAPGFHPPQKTAAVRALHIKNPPTHKARHWWIRWHPLRHIHFLTVSLYICCQLLSRGEKHFPVFIWQPLHEAISHDLHIN